MVSKLERFTIIGEKWTSDKNGYDGWIGWVFWWSSKNYEPNIRHWYNNIYNWTIFATIKKHLPVARYVNEQEFKDYKQIGLDLGFDIVESGPLVRSSYHADEQARIVMEQKWDQK